MLTGNWSSMTPLMFDSTTQGASISSPTKFGGGPTSAAPSEPAHGSHYGLV